MTGLSTNKVRVRDFFLSTFSGCEKKKIFIKWTKQQKITAYTIQDQKKNG
jgi:hypothetical protein